MPFFDGQEAVIVKQAGTIDIYYGGLWKPDGEGHGHVKAQGHTCGECIVYWRLPDREGGRVVIDNWASEERLSSHLSGLY